MKIEKLISEIITNLEKKIGIGDFAPYFDDRGDSWIEVSVCLVDQSVWNVSTLLYKKDKKVTQEVFDDHLSFCESVQEESLKDALIIMLEAVKEYEPKKMCECCKQQIKNGT